MNSQTASGNPVPEIIPAQVFQGSVAGEFPKSIGLSRITKIQVTIQAFLAFLFFFAGGLKIMSGPAPTKVALLTIGIENSAIVSFIGNTLPYFELALGLWLVLGVQSRMSAGITVAFFSTATVALVAMGLATGWRAPCNCTGTGGGGTIYMAIIRNIVLLGLAFWLAYQFSKPISSPKSAQ